MFYIFYAESVIQILLHLMVKHKRKGIMCIPNNGFWLHNKEMIESLIIKHECLQF